jgi:hypothetical protein
MPKNFVQASIALSDLIRRKQAIPFQKFRIITLSGKSYEVPTADHVTITGIRKEVIIEKDDGMSVWLNPLHIVAIETDALTDAG